MHGISEDSWPAGGTHLTKESKITGLRQKEHLINPPKFRLKSPLNASQSFEPIITTSSSFYLKLSINIFPQLQICQFLSTNFFEEFSRSSFSQGRDHDECKLYYIGNIILLAHFRWFVLNRAIIFIFFDKNLNCRTKNLKNRFEHNKNCYEQIYLINWCHSHYKLVLWLRVFYEPLGYVVTL